MTNIQQSYSKKVLYQQCMQIYLNHYNKIWGMRYTLKGVYEM